MSMLSGSRQYHTPTTGNTITIKPADVSNTILIDPAGTLDSLTIAIPGTPVDGMLLILYTSEMIKSLSFTGGTFKKTAPVRMSAQTFLTFFYLSATNMWYQISGGSQTPAENCLIKNFSIGANASSVVDNDFIGASIKFVFLSGVMIPPPYTFNSTTGTLTISVLIGDSLTVLYTR